MNYTLYAGSLLVTNSRAGLALSTCHKEMYVLSLVFGCLHSAETKLNHCMMYKYVFRSPFLFLAVSPLVFSLCTFVVVAYSDLPNITHIDGVDGEHVCAALFKVIGRFFQQNPLVLSFCSEYAHVYSRVCPSSKSKRKEKAERSKREKVSTLSNEFSGLSYPRILPVTTDTFVIAH